MTLTPGTRLGPYEILSPLGAGGMGEVYRARDTRLERTVAIKVLPPHLSQNPEFRQRFEREAKTISSLSHPHICGLYDVGHQDGTDYLVMEFLEGETLTERLAKGSLPTEQVLRYGIEMADALDKAHRQGVIHRDLKPGNIMLTKSGVKLVDFGLAKFTAPGAAHLSSATALPTQAPDLTAEGTILGTFQYMAPEQLEGKEADGRTDIFALGAVLYEMATGQKAFSGKSQASLISSIMSSEPPAISAIQPMTPPALDRVARTCLAKDPEDRWQTAHDIAVQLRWIQEGGSAAGLPAAVIARRRTLRWLPWTAAVLLTAVGLAVGYFLRAPGPAPLLRASLALPDGFEMDSQNASVALSPDALKVALAGSVPGGPPQLWVRPLDSLAAQPVPGTEGATYPFWSPDGRFIGFFADQKLKKVPASGGTVQTICEATDGRGASWNQDGVIVLSPGPLEGLFRVPASGGSPVRITRVERPGGTHRLPRFLPDGKRLLFLSGDTSHKNDGIYRLDLDSRKTALVARERSEGRYVEPGYLAFARDGNLMVQPIDGGTLRTKGEAVPIAEAIQFNEYRWTGNFALSDTGLLLYLTGSLVRRAQLTWFDSDGKELEKVGEPAPFLDVSLAPAGNRAAATVRSDRFDLWMYDLGRGLGSRFTFGPDPAAFPVWSPDGRQMAYADGYGSISLKAADGASAARKVVSERSMTRIPTSWSPDGSKIAFWVQTTSAGIDLWILPLDGNRKPYPFIATPANEGWGVFSPDGRWLLYSSNESGRNEMYVVPFPGPGGKWQISSGGAGSRIAAPAREAGIWLGDGDQIVYTRDFKLYAVNITVRGPNLEIGPSRPLFGGRALTGPFSVTRDGKRLLQAVPTEKSASTLTLVTNWKAELQK